MQVYCTVRDSGWTGGILTSITPNRQQLYGLFLESVFPIYTAAFSAYEPAQTSCCSWSHSRHTAFCLQRAAVLPRLLLFSVQGLRIWFCVLQPVTGIVHRAPRSFAICYFLCGRGKQNITFRTYFLEMNLTQSFNGEFF